MRSQRVKKTRTSKKQAFAYCFGLVVIFLTAVLVYATRTLMSTGTVLLRTPQCTGPQLNLSVAAAEGLERQKVLIPGAKILNNSMYDNSFSLLPRAATAEIKAGLINLLEDFIILLDKHNITYFMSEGMLLGSFLFHDLIPWDDDIDLMIDIKDMNKVRAMLRDKEIRSKYGSHSFHDPVDMYSDETILEDIPTNNTRTCGKKNPTLVCYQKGKIYYKTSAHAGGYEWRYPFIDFIFYATNKTHMYNHESPNEKRIEIPLDDFQPFHLRPYNRLWIVAPRKPMKFLKIKFGRFQCKQGWWNHQKERMAYTMNPYSVRCSKIDTCYAHVRRRPPSEVEQKTTPQFKVVEELVIGDNILQSVFLDEEYEYKYELTLDRI